MTSRLTLGLIASALVAVVSLAILVFAYPPRAALDHDRKADCREVRNTVGRIVARVCGEQGETTVPPHSGGTNRPLGPFVRASDTLGALLWTFFGTSNAPDSGPVASVADPYRTGAE
jgi:hypothetical protein